MGARAAVMAATDDTQQLILVSYPLHTDKEVRDQILLDLRPDIDVLFIIGSKDSMCDIQRLRQVRENMKGKTWLVTVRDGDHGMNLKPKKASEDVVKMTGQVAAEWLKLHNPEQTESEIIWDAEESVAQHTGWEASLIGKTKKRTAKESKTESKPRKAPKRKAPGKSSIADGEAPATRASKRKRPGR